MPAGAAGPPGPAGRGVHGGDGRAAVRGRAEDSGKHRGLAALRGQEADETSYRLWAKRSEDLFVPGAEFLIVDTGWHAGVPIGLYGSRLVFAANLDDAMHHRAQLYFIDLARGVEPIQTIASAEDNIILYFPCISDHYIVWIQYVGFVSQTAHGIRLEDGLPVGDPFPVSSGQFGGSSFINLDGNIAAWNAST